MCNPLYSKQDESPKAFLYRELSELSIGMNLKVLNATGRATDALMTLISTLYLCRQGDTIFWIFNLAECRLAGCGRGLALELAGPDDRAILRPRIFARSEFTSDSLAAGSDISEPRWTFISFLCRIICIFLVSCCDAKLTDDAIDKNRIRGVSSIQYPISNKCRCVCHNMYQIIICYFFRDRMYKLFAYPV